MSSIDFRTIKGMGRDCPHLGCGFVISLEAIPLLDEARQHRCEQCKSIIPWIEIKRMKKMLEDIQDLAHSSTAYRILT